MEVGAKLTGSNHRLVTWWYLYIFPILPYCKFRVFDASVDRCFRCSSGKIQGFVQSADDVKECRKHFNGKDIKVIWPMSNR